MSAKTAATKGTPETLVRKCFVVLEENDDPARWLGKLKPRYQGIVLAQVSPTKFLIQFFEWLTGCPDHMLVVDVDEMSAALPKYCKPSAWMFFHSDEGMRDFIDSCRASDHR